MSFKNKMKNRGISKLDNLVETPDYITPVKPKKVSWNWLKIAIPVVAGLALIVIPISIISGSGLFANKSALKGDYSSHDGYDNYAPSEPTYKDETSQIDTSFQQLLAKHSVGNNFIIEVYDYADGYTEPTYTFEGEIKQTIANSLAMINSDYDAYYTKVSSPSTNRNSAGYIMGINHRLIFKNGNNKLVAHYFSQFATLVVDQSAFDLTGSLAYSTMDEHIEMDYNPTFDETIN